MSRSDVILDLLFLILGLVFGSFITALSFRFPKGISVIRGRSFCPKCKKTIRWYDNIPVLSYIFLLGRCRNCKKKISVRYPLIELTTGLGFLILFLKLSPNYPELFYSLILFCILMLIFVIDLEHRIIPDDFVFFGILLVFLHSLNTFPPILFSNLLSGFLVALLLLLIHLATRGRGMGLGDVKFAVLGGMIVGLPMCLVWLFLAFLTGGIVGIILILGRKAGLKDQIAFGPFLVLAIALTYLFGDKLLVFMGLKL